MAFEKAKVQKAAEKFLSQGKINAAIKEYRQIIENDNDDLTALNMLGDLLARAGENDEAITCFSRIAEHYREQEFRLKAIAMYRKIEKLKPREPETAAKLADLYAAQGLIVDARAQHMVVADAHVKAGKTKEALEVLHKIADLDPQNTEVRLKLAEGYLKEDMRADAGRAFAEAAGRLLEKSDFEQSLYAYTKALELQPWNKTVLRGLTRVHAALGTAEDAAELLENAIKEQPEDPELLDMLAHAYIEARDAAGAERAISQVVSRDASEYRRYIEVLKLYLKLGEPNDAARILELIIEPMLSGREENDLLELIGQLLATEPEHVAGLRLLARVHWWQRDMDKLRAVLERLVESAETSGFVEDERYALTQLVRLVPDDLRFNERLEELGGSLEDAVDGAQLEDPAAESVAAFEAFALVHEATDEAEPQTANNEGEFEWNSVAEPAIADANASFADLNEPEQEAGSEVHIFSDDLSVSSEDQGFVFGASETTSATETRETNPVTASNVQAMMKQELESVDFYIKQGYSDIALDTLELLERQFGSQPEIEVRRLELHGKGPTLAAIRESHGEVIPNKSGLETGVRNATAAETTLDAEQSSSNTVKPNAVSGIDSGLAEIFEEFRLEAEGDDQASSTEDYETHYNMATAYKEMDLLDEAIREFQAAATLAAGGSARYFQCCNMLGHCFVEKGMPQAAVLWFRKGIETPGRSAEEYKALQYELGAAYEQMGDLKQAVAAFTEVYGVDVSYRDVAERLNDLRKR